MKICRNIPPAETCCGIRTAATLGTFDGVHIGHRTILEKVMSHARDAGLESAVITFDSHPYTVLAPDKAPGMLTTLDEKLALFEEIGLDFAYVIPFSREISLLSPEEFAKRFLVGCLGMVHFVVGYDHGFGKDREGSASLTDDLARALGFTVDIVQPVRRNGETVNSSLIRSRIASGDMGDVSCLLGRDYSFSGTVVPGCGEGRKIGVPTANIVPGDPMKIVPGKGVYTGWIIVAGKKADMVMSIGSQPTFDRHDETIEVHIPDFEGDLYGVSVTIGVTGRIRDIMQFDSKEKLVRRIMEDIDILYQHTTQ